MKYRNFKQQFQTVLECFSKRATKINTSSKSQGLRVTWDKIRVVLNIKESIVESIVSFGSQYYLWFHNKFTMPLCYRIRHILLKIRQYFTTKCDSFNTKCDDFITEFYSYYKMRCLLQNSSEHFSCLNPVLISCLFLSKSFSVFFFYSIFLLSSSFSVFYHVFIVFFLPSKYF